MTELPEENVQSYPRPPALEPVPHLVEVVFGGVRIVDTRHALRVLETHHAPTYYIPTSEIRAELRPTVGRSFCEWKGQARYYDLAAGDAVAPRAVWGYDAPTASFAALKGHVAIYASQLDAVRVGGVAVIPQPGDFYGGWVTPNLRGQIKGAPGTLHW